MNVSGNLWVSDLVAVRMIATPFKSALAAALYIVFITLGLYNAEVIFGSQETILIPIVMLSLFVLSAAIMGLLFLAEPLRLYLDGNPRDGLRFFVHTIGWFAVFVVFAIAAVFVSSLL